MKGGCKAAHVLGWPNDDEKILASHHLWSICILVIYLPMSAKKRAHGPESLMEFHKGKEQHHLLPRILLLPSLFFPIAYSSGLHEDANEVDFQRMGYLGERICVYLRYVNWWQDRKGLRRCPAFAKYQTSK